MTHFPVVAKLIEDYQLFIHLFSFALFYLLKNTVQLEEVKHKLLIHLSSSEFRYRSTQYCLKDSAKFPVCRVFGNISRKYLNIVDKAIDS